MSKIDDLKVAARTSAFSFKGKNVNVSEIGARLSVNHVLEGSVRRSGNRLRISVQLVNASDGFHLWSERYDREMRDIFKDDPFWTNGMRASVRINRWVKAFPDRKVAI